MGPSNTDGRLDEIRSLRDGWDSFDAPRPSEVALNWARAAIGPAKSAWHKQKRPSITLTPSAEGGICLSFRDGDRYGVIECDNDGDVYAIISDGADFVRSWPVDASGDGARLAACEICKYLRMGS